MPRQWGLPVNLFNQSVFHFIITQHPVRSEYFCVYLSLWLTVPTHSERCRASPGGGRQARGRVEKEIEKEL